MLRTLALCLAGCVLTASAAVADDDIGRFQLEPARDGFVRLDTKTGQLSHCRRKIVGWVCDEASDDLSLRDDRRKDDLPRARDGGKKGAPPVAEAPAANDRMAAAPPDMRDGGEKKVGRLERENEKLKGAVAALESDFDRLRRDNRRLRAENDELRAMIEGGASGMLPRDDRDGAPLRRDRSPGVIEGPGPIEPPAPERRGEGPKANEDDTDRMHALIDRMIERFRDMVRELQNGVEDQAL
jgi:hypothetical protein